ncbi:hypothetical protein N7447_003480 [Penicillium robsamsonii]|uniref:uncharacterized protein n=1 Tax=Penicillium robsamsonii TaxID=1792511 RepID=UPI0025484E28|nr:uncharacterized protein N7447_003480 [Penicillium robsamsonii]KAJ5826717.1 hypothetical protein N7447_003480 [Penicillium robsamsonii]
MVANVTFQTPSVAPSPLPVPVMLAPIVLVLAQTLNYPVKCVLADFDICISRDFFVYCLNCHFLNKIRGRIY